MTGRVECRYYGRDFTAGEMALLRALIAVDPQPTRAGLSREFCRLIGWFKPDGGLKDHEYPDGHLAVFHGPRCLARYRADGETIDDDRLQAA